MCNALPGCFVIKHFSQIKSSILASSINGIIIRMYYLHLPILASYSYVEMYAANIIYNRLYRQLNLVMQIVQPKHMDS